MKFIMPRNTSRIVMLILALVSTSAYPVIIGNFAGGNGTVASNQYTGTGGDGWANGWQSVAIGSGITFAGSVENSNPIPVSSLTSNYLNIDINRTTTATRQMTLYRSYTNFGSINLANNHDVDVVFRVNDLTGLTGTTQYFGLMDTSSDLAVDSNFNPLNVGNVAWALWAYGANATFGDRKLLFSGRVPNTTTLTNIDTGITLTEGITYRLSIALNMSAQEYTGTIHDLTNDVSFTTTLRFRDTTSVSGQIGLGFRAGGDIDYDLQNISIIPEPGVLHLGLLAAVFCYFLRRRGEQAA